MMAEITNVVAFSTVFSRDVNAAPVCETLSVTCAFVGDWPLFSFGRGPVVQPAEIGFAEYKADRDGETESPSTKDG